MMNFLKNPKFPDDAKVVGRVYSSDIPCCLSEDMLEVSLYNGILISCGFYHDGYIDDPSGVYKIDASIGLDFIERRTSTNAEEGLKHVIELVDKYNHVNG
jgi:hypothetical protein